MTNNYKYLLSKTQRKAPKGSMQKISESLWRRKNKRRKNARERYQNFTEEKKQKRRNKDLDKEQKQKLVGYKINHYLTHNKQLLRDFIDFLKIWDN